MKTLVVTLVVAISSFVSGTLGFFHVSPAARQLTPPVNDLSVSTRRADSQSSSTSVVQAPRSNQLPDCATGTPAIDTQGNPTSATKTSAHVYAYVIDGAGDSNNACGTYTLVVADPETFLALDQYYGKDANGVWFIQNPWSGSEGGTNIYQIPGADAATFNLICDPFTVGPWPQFPDEGFSPWYAKDKNHVYFYGEVVVGVDPTTFAVNDPPAGTSCDFYDAHDSLHYYYRGGLRPPPTQWTNNCP